MTIHTQSHTGRIYVACLASYNAGILHGEWIEVTEFADDLKARVQAMLDRSPEPYAEEWAIHDHEGFDRLSEYEDLDDLAERVGYWEQYGQDEVEAYISHFGDFDEDKFQDRYCGTCENYHNAQRRWACDRFNELDLCHFTDDQKATFWNYADEDHILREMEHYTSFISCVTNNHTCYIFQDY